jgi:hypothetical protein
MIRTTLAAAFLAIATAAVQPGTAVQPSGAPVTQPATQSATQPMGAGRAGAQPTSRPVLPVEFEVLQKRNVFAHGPRRGGAGAAGAGGPEATFVLKGVVEAQGRFTAFVEDKSSKRVESLSEGATLASGHITGMTLDGIEYKGAGNARRIAVGQNLNGEVVPPTPTSKPAAPAGGPGAPGHPGGAAPGQPPGRPGVPGAPPPGAVPMVKPGG